MKYLFGLLFGILLGAVCAAALIYINPLINDVGRPATVDAAPLRYSLDGPQMLASTHNRWPGVPIAPVGVQQLWESGIEGSWLASFVITGPDQTTAIATKFVVPLPRSNAIDAGLVTEDQWLITLPGSGSLIAVGASNAWPLLRDTTVRVDLLGRHWAGTAQYATLAGGRARAAGLSGELAGRSGTLQETLVLDDYPQSGFAGLSGNVGIALEAGP